MEGEDKPVGFDAFIESGFEESASPFLTRSGRRFARYMPLKASIVAAAFFLLSLGLSFFTATAALSQLLLVIVYFIAGIPSLISSIEDLLDFEINIDVLMTLAAFLSILIGSSMEGALLLVLFSLSGAIEEAVTMKAKSTLSHLKYLSPPMAFVIMEDGNVLQRSVKDILPGTQILIKAGQVVPLDGIVREGASSVNLVHLTGENLPVAKQVGDEVAAGARNIEGALTLEVLRTSADSTLEKLIQLITKAQEARPRLQRFIDKLSNRYAITIITLAALFAIFLPLIFHMPYLGNEGSVYRALAFLVAASPCALIIAIPIAYLSALSACAKKGILLKGGIVLDALARCKVFSFDKTGTLTTGKLSLVSITPLGSFTEAEKDEALSIALALERGALHPIAQAIIDYGQERQIKPAPLSEFQAIPGFGLKATVHLPERPSAPVAIGKPDSSFFEGSPENKQALEERQNKAKEEGQLLAVLQHGDKFTLFQFQDTPRPGIKQVIATLKRRFRLLMLTGDHYESAKTVAEEVGIEDFHAGLKPEDKLRIVEELSEKDGLAMIGDGINDAPALARATVGISMGKVGSSTAIDASDVVLLHDNLELLEWLIEKAHATLRIVSQNVILAGAVIAFATTPALLGIVPLWAAVLMHEGGTVLVGLNGLRLLRKH